MAPGIVLSGGLHGLLIAMTLLGLPWMSSSEDAPTRVTEVSFVTEAELEELRAAAAAVTAANAPPVQAEAPTQPSEPVVEAETEPSDEPPVAETAAPEVPQDVAPTLAPAFDPEAPLSAPQVEIALAPQLDAPDQAPERSIAQPEFPSQAPLDPLTEPLARPSPRISETLNPPELEDTQSAALTTPETAPTPDAPELPQQAPSAPPESAPEPVAAPDAAPEIPLVLESASPPLPRRGNVSPPQTPDDPPEPPVAVASAEPTVDAVQAAIEDAVRASATPPTPATAPSVTAPAGAVSSLPQGPPLSASERDQLIQAISACWSVPDGLRDAGDLEIVVGAKLNSDGSVVDGSVSLIDPSSPPDQRYRTAYEQARRAVLRCAPYGFMSPEKYGQWANLALTFKPGSMVTW